MLFAESAHIIVLGNYWKQLVCDRLPEVESKVTILRNATKSAIDHAAPRGAFVQISFLGQLGERKGTYNLIDALGQLKSLETGRQL